MTEKHKQFCLEYLKNGMNATRSYETVYETKNEKTARSNGHKLLKRTDISTYIQEEIDRIKNEKIADIDEILTNLTSIIRGEKLEEIPILKGEGKQEIIEKKPGLKEVNKSIELLMKYYNIGNKKEIDIKNESEIKILDVIQKLDENKNDEYEE